MCVRLLNRKEGELSLSACAKRAVRFIMFVCMFDFPDDATNSATQHYMITVCDLSFTVALDVVITAGTNSTKRKQKKNAARSFQEKKQVY